MARRGARSGGDPAAGQPPLTTSGPAVVPAVVVGVGASTGGLEAAQQLLARVPDDAGIAFVLLLRQRRDPRQLASEVARQTRMRVELVQAPARVEAGTVYLVAPVFVATMKLGTLSVGPQDDAPARGAIDTFFRSLAKDLGESAVGVVLSGSGSDGTAGLRAIQEHGGLTLAQAPQTASDPSLPQAAIGAGLVDVVAPPERIAGRILDHGRAVARSCSAASTTTEQDLRARVGDLCRILELRTGHDFSRYQRDALIRRIRRRLLVHDAASVAAYALLLAQDPKEPDRLLRDLLAGATRFFRDPEAFAALAATVLPAIVRDQAPELPIRVWVPGCGSGEEAYSIAMLVREAMERAGRPRLVQIFATDIDTEMLAAARRGRFPEAIAADVTPERLARFFVRDGAGYVAVPSLRETCLFSRHSLVRDPPFSNLDFICCRNVLCYLEPEMQEKLVPLLHYALRPGGYLLLGAGEDLVRTAGLFEPVDEQHRLFRRGGRATPRMVLPLSAGRLGSIPAPGSAEARAEAGRSPAQRRLTVAFERTVLDEYTPPCALVDAGGEQHAAVARLESELRATQSELRRTSEELQTTLEALRSADQELAGLREQLQSSNEELLTSHQQLRAFSEELATLRREAEWTTASHGTPPRLDRRRDRPASRAVRMNHGWASRRPG